MNLEELRWKKFAVLDQGFVCLVDVMGDDAAVVQAARVSYGAGTRRVSDDETLLRFLMRHSHWTPFEMAEIKFLVRVPMDCWRQWIRHRTASVNEYSTRYSEAIDAAQGTAADAWRLQDVTNRQGSGAFLPADAGLALTADEQVVQKESRAVYERRLKAGVAREQARKDLPLSTYTEAYWKCDLRNVLNFLSLRLDAHAQREIREYAAVIGEQIVATLFPMTWSAFNDYDFRRNALLLTRLEVDVVRSILTGGKTLVEAMSAVGWPAPPAKCRERDECFVKLNRLGVATNNG